MDAQVTATDRAEAPRPRSEARPVLILVHGTGDAGSDRDPNGREPSSAGRWWSASSSFSRWLALRLTSSAGEPLDRSGMVVRFRWSGANSERDREAGARALSQVLAKLAREGRRIHVLAHSHGGNVVRRALELGDAGPPVPIASVISFGTPFFRYSGVTRFLTAAWSVGLCLLAGVGAWLLGTSSFPAPWKTLALFAVGGALISLGLAAAATVRPRRAPHPSVLRRLADATPWTNLCAGRDEALGLLESLNQPVRLMRQDDPFMAWPNFIKAACVLLGIGVAVVADTLLYEFLMEQRRDYAPHGPSWLFVAWSLFGVGLTSLCMAWLVLVSVFDRLMTAISTGVDLVLSARMRALAFGDDRGFGIVGVSRAPWGSIGHEPLPPAIEAEIEAHIARRTTSLWKNLRAALAPDLPLAGQDIRRIADEVLTWDELAHTAYGRVRGFADLVIEHLERTGDWKARGPADLPDAATKVWDLAKAPSRAPSRSSPRKPPPPMATIPKTESPAVISPDVIGLERMPDSQFLKPFLR